MLFSDEVYIFVVFTSCKSPEPVPALRLFRACKLSLQCLRNCLKRSSHLITYELDELK